MLELQGNQLVFSFPKIHPKATLKVEFQRTLRIPDDDKNYPLPPGLGQFPMKHTEDYLDKLPPHWKEHGGVFLPLYQAEALWINFVSTELPEHGYVPYPFLVKVGTGKKSALTGKDWRKGIHKGDYCVAPDPQQWLDGYVVEEGIIKQFVAVPLGSGLSVEEQLGGPGIGGIQIEVLPMKADCFERRWPKREVPERIGGGVLRGATGQTLGGGGGFGPFSSYAPPGVYTQTLSKGSSSGPPAQGTFCCDSSLSPTLNASLSEDSLAIPGAAAADCREEKTGGMLEIAEMSLGAGGRMAQQIFEDPYGKDEWSRKSDGVRRTFVHLANSGAWQAVTGERPPETPVTAAVYNSYGYPWFDYYDDGLPAKKGSKKLKGIKSVKDKAKELGLKGVLPENQSTKVKKKNILICKPPKQVAEGKW